MSGFETHDLLSLTLSVILDRPSFDLKMLLSGAVLPSSLANRIFYECSRTSKSLSWCSIFKAKSLAVLTQVYISFKKELITGLANYYMSMEMSEVRVLTLDLKDYFVTSSNIYLTAFITIRLLSSKINHLKHLIIKWNESSQFKTAFRDISLLLHHLLHSNPHIHAITLQEKCVKENHEYTSYNNNRRDDSSNDIESVLSFVCSLPPNLQHLAIIRHGNFVQGCKIFQPLCNRCFNLRSISLHGALNVYSPIDSNIDLLALLQLHDLRELDISVDREALNLDDAAWAYDVAHLVSGLLDALLQSSSCRINILDLSGVGGIRRDVLKRFIQTYHSLTCLRLCMTQYMLTTLKYIDIPSNVQVLECHTFSGALECIRLYRHCNVFSRHALLAFFNLKPPPDPALIHSSLKEIQITLETYKKNPEICLASTACLHNVVNCMGEASIPFVSMGNCIDLIVKIVKKYASNHQIVRNCLVITCKEALVLHVKFNHYKCIKHCFSVLRSYSVDSESPNARMAVALISLLAAMIPSARTRRLASCANLSVLLDIIADRTRSMNSDSLLYHALVCTWNLTDECPAACSRFIALNGIKTYLEVFDTFPGVNSIETKIFGLLNNISEVPQLRPYILQTRLALLLMRHVKGGKLPSAFFAAGVIANVLIYWNHFPNLLLPEFHVSHAKEILLQGVHNFGLENAQEIVVYRSFAPFLPLLEASELPETQWWAVWSMRHVTKLQGDKYKPFVQYSTPLTNALSKLLDHPWQYMRQSAADILNFLK